jgi:hypothetical protein
LRATLVDEPVKVVVNDMAEVRQQLRDRSKPCIHDQIDSGARPFVL